MPSLKEDTVVRQSRFDSFHWRNYKKANLREYGEELYNPINNSAFSAVKFCSIFTGITLFWKKPKIKINFLIFDSKQCFVNKYKCSNKYL